MKTLNAERERHWLNIEKGVLIYFQELENKKPKGSRKQKWLKLAYLSLWLRRRKSSYGSIIAKTS